MSYEPPSFVPIAQDFAGGVLVTTVAVMQYGRAIRIEQAIWWQDKIAEVATYWADDWSRKTALCQHEKLCAELTALWG